MELGLSLGNRRVELESADNLGVCMGLGLKESSPPSEKLGEDLDDLDHHRINQTEETRRDKVGSPSLRLHLHPLSPVPRHTQPPPLRFPWRADNLSSESDGGRVNRRETEAEAEAEEESSPNSGTSSFMEFSLYTKGGRRESGSRGGGSEDEENGTSTRKKLRLSKEQSAFLEESFKEHHTLNPKQKLELAKQLNLRPRQVEVWFQNRRARTKLKQTEVDCEYLKRCCETLTEENRRLQKELQELRALKTSQPFFMSLPATTLTMCPSCERTTTTTTAAATAPDSNTTLSLGKPKPMLPFSQAQHAPS